MLKNLPLKSSRLLLPLLFISIKSWAMLDTPKLIPTSHRLARLELGTSATKALKKFDPQFEIIGEEKFLLNVQTLFKESYSEEIPQAAIGDFNGDRVPDVALMGKSHGKILTLALISSKNEYKPVVIQQELKYEEKKKGLINYLVKLPAQEQIQGQESIEKKFKNDAIKIETFLGPSHLYYFKDGKFHEWKRDNI